MRGARGCAASRRTAGIGRTCSPQADAARPAADRTKYPVAAVVQWTSPPATVLFEAARAPGSPPGNESTELSILLDNPHKPRRF